MKAFLSIVTVMCFTFSTLGSASIHTLIEMQVASERNRLIAASLVDMPLRQLAEVKI